MKTPEDGDKLNTGLGAPIRKEKPAPQDVQVGKHTYRGKDGKLYTADPENEKARGFIPPGVYSAQSIYEFFGMKRP